MLANEIVSQNLLVGLERAITLTAQKANSYNYDFRDPSTRLLHDDLHSSRALLQRFLSDNLEFRPEPPPPLCVRWCNWLFGVPYIAPSMVVTYTDVIANEDALADLIKRLHLAQAKLGQGVVLDGSFSELPIPDRANILPDILDCMDALTAVLKIADPEYQRPF